MSQFKKTKQKVHRASHPLWIQTGTERQGLSESWKDQNVRRPQKCPEQAERMQGSEGNVQELDVTSSACEEKTDSSPRKQEKKPMRWQQERNVEEKTGDQFNEPKWENQKIRAGNTMKRKLSQKQRKHLTESKGAHLQILNPLHVPAQQMTKSLLQGTACCIFRTARIKKKLKRYWSIHREERRKKNKTQNHIEKDQGIKCPPTS